MLRNSTKGSHPYTVIAKEKNSVGYPEYNKRTREYAFTSLAEATKLAEEEAAKGFWVDVYADLFYDTGARL